MTDQGILRQIQRALRKGDELSDAQIAKLAELQRAANAGKRHVAVSKLALREGEELWEFVDAVWMAVQTNRVILADGSLDARLMGIFDDFVIVQDGNTGRTFKSTFTRNEKGEFAFAPPVEVRQVFVEVEAADEDVERAVAKRRADAPEFVDVSRGRSESKFGFLPATLRGRR